MSTHRTSLTRDGDVMEHLRAARPVSGGEVDLVLAEHAGPALARALAGPGPTTAPQREGEHPRARLQAQRQRAERREQALSLAPAHRRAGLRRAWAAAGMGIAAAATVALVLTGQPASPGPSSGAPGTVVATTTRPAATAPAGTALIALAAAARTEAPAAGSVAYTATTDAYRQHPRVGDLTTSTTRLWKAPDGSGRLEAPVANAGQGSPPAPQRDENSWAPGDSPDGGSWRAGVLRGVVVADLPSDPGAMAAAVSTWAQSQPAMVGGEEPGTTADAELGFLGALLAEPTATPTQRAAAFEVLAARDDVGLLGEHVDPLGRSGTAVAYDLRSSGTYQVTLTFNATTSTLLAREDALVDLAGQWQEGTALGPWSSTAWTTSTTVDAVGQLPAAQKRAGA